MYDFRDVCADELPLRDGLVDRIFDLDNLQIVIMPQIIGFSFLYRL